MKRYLILLIGFVTSLSMFAVDTIPAVQISVEFDAADVEEAMEINKLNTTKYGADVFELVCGFKVVLPSGTKVVSDYNYFWQNYGTDQKFSGLLTNFMETKRINVLSTDTIHTNINQDTLVYHVAYTLDKSVWNSIKKDLRVNFEVGRAIAIEVFEDSLFTTKHMNIKSVSIQPLEIRGSIFKKADVINDDLTEFRVNPQIKLSGLSVKGDFNNLQFLFTVGQNFTEEMVDEFLANKSTFVPQYGIIWILKKKGEYDNGTFTTEIMQRCREKWVAPSQYYYRSWHGVMTFFSEEFVSLTTGIQRLASDKEHAPIYYDLSGKRVETPTRGIFIVDTGVKRYKKMFN